MNSCRPTEHILAVFRDIYKNEGEEDKFMDLENNAKNTNNIIIENSVDHQQINNNHSKIIQQSKCTSR